MIYTVREIDDKLMYMYNEIDRQIIIQLNTNDIQYKQICRCIKRQVDITIQVIRNHIYRDMINIWTDRLKYIDRQRKIQIENIHIWIDRFMDRQIYGQIDLWIGRFMDKQIYG